MRTFCAILLLGAVTYVQGEHGCASIAVNVAESKVERTPEDARNPSLSLETFLAREISTFYTAEATPNGTPDACTAPTHGSNCGGVEYTRKLWPNQRTIDPNQLFLGKKFETTFIGYNKEKKFATEYKMTIGGADKHNFIFKHVASTPIAAFKISNVQDPESSRAPTNIEPAILSVIQSEFALFRYKPGKYSIYTTCNLETAWVTYGKGTTYNEQDAELREDLVALESLAASKEKTLEVKPIDREFTQALSDYLGKVFD